MPILLARAVFSVLFGGLGVFFLYLVAALVRRRAEWRRGELVDGEVIALKERKPASAKSRSTFAPVVLFRDHTGEARRFTSSESQSRSPYEVGQRVSVRYLPNDLKSVEIDEVTRRWWPLLATLVLALACLTVSVLPFVLN